MAYKDKKEKVYYQKNKEIILAKKKEYYYRNRDKLLKQKKEYHKKPEIQERTKKYQKEYYKIYREKPDVKKRQKAYSKEYWINNKKSIKKYRERRKEITKEYMKSWRKRNRDYIKEKHREYAKSYNQKPEVKQKKKEWYEKNKEKRAVSIRKWTEKNKERKLKTTLEWAKRNPQKVRENQRKFHQSPKGKLSAIRKRKIRGSEPSVYKILNEEEIGIIKERDKECVYCRHKGKLTFEHIISLNKGGNHQFYNFVLACGSCNFSKGDKDVFKWCKSKGYKVPKIIINNIDKLIKDTGRTIILIFALLLGV